VLAELLNRMALLRGANFGVAQAEPLARESLKLRQQHAPGDYEHLAESMTTLGNILTSRGQREESSRLLNEALALREKLDPNSAGVASSLHSLALHSQRFEAFDQAFEQFRRSLAVRKALVGEGHPDHLITLEEYGNALNQARRYAEAEAVIRQALEHRKRLHGAGNEKVAFNLNVLGSILNRQGRQREAIEIYREALAIVAGKFGKRSMPYASVINNLAIPLQNSGDLQGAEQAYVEAMTTFESLWPDDDLTLARVRFNVGRIRTQMGDLAGAENPLQRSLATRLKVLGDKHGDVLESLVTQGEWQAARKDYTAAEATIARLLPQQPFKDLFTEVNFAKLRGQVAAGQGKRAVAQEQYLRAEELARKAFGNNAARAVLVMRERMEWLARSQSAADRAEATALARDILARLGDKPEVDAKVLLRLQTLAKGATP
jgi:tetratricopeptide (TPR) repeat protein